MHGSNLLKTSGDAKYYGVGEEDFFGFHGSVEVLQDLQWRQFVSRWVKALGLDIEELKVTLPEQTVNE